MSLLKDFHRYFSKLLPDEKIRFNNGIAVRLGAGNDAVDPNWNYGIFYPANSDSVHIYKWHSLFPVHFIPGQEVVLTKSNPTDELAIELMGLINEGDQRPDMNIVR